MAASNFLIAILMHPHSKPAIFCLTPSYIFIFQTPLILLLLCTFRNQLLRLQLFLLPDSMIFGKPLLLHSEESDGVRDDFLAPSLMVLVLGH